MESTELIIAEKPSVALRIAIALSSSAPKRVKKGRVSYFEIETGRGKAYIAAAAGHLFTIKQKDEKRGYPVLEVEWAPSYEVSKSSYYTKDYIEVIKSLAKNAESYINACDYDIEGTVIGTNIIRFLATEDNSKIKRMKFSTTTTIDLRNSYEDLQPIDINNFYAGETRHMLDWLWGINFSRALTSVMENKGQVLSIGRVQGPTLALLAKREEEINSFISEPYWKIKADINNEEFLSDRGNLFDKKEADELFNKCNSYKAKIESIESSEREVAPYPPFDLTSLQLEASRILHMDPTRTLAIAQSLYEKSYISYPRTSSQKLPATLGLKSIIENISKIEKYKELCSKLIQENRFRPHNGKKEDEAHPAIYPTGVAPKLLTEEEEKLYNLITRRFLGCFAEPAELADTSIKATINGESFSAKALKIIKKGWMEFYPFATISEHIMEGFEKGKEYPAILKMESLKTQPPKRYSKAMLIAELEKRELGTKATRAAIVDTLYKRNYITGSKITVTPFGMSIYKVLKENCNMILEEETTRALEKDMEKISKGERSESEVLAEGKRILLEAIKTFDENKNRISDQVHKGAKESMTILGKCPVDGGDLIIRKSRLGKQFVGCSNYPNCKVTYPLPQKAKIVATGKVCEYCNAPIVKVIRWNGSAYELDINPNCESKVPSNQKEDKNKEITNKAKNAVRNSASKKKAKTTSRASKSKKAKTSKIKKEDA
ncbi:MAG: DNA topoisomerase I [Candidatus Micrarchaeia archaeon]